MLLILGTGHAGYTLAREVRRLDPARPITLLTADAGASYYKPDLSKSLSAGKAPPALVRADAPAMAAQLAATVETGVEVARLDAAGRTVTAVDGRAWTYTDCVLALGSEPVRLALGGDAAADVLSVNSHADYATFRARLSPGLDVAILGAGLVGTEFAHDLATAGHAVTVADTAGWPLPKLLPEPLGRALMAAMAGLPGPVAWRFGAGATAVDRAGPGYTVRFADGSAVTAGLVLSAVGLKPRTDLARAAGLACGRGVAVDAAGRTSAAHVFALGDCTEHDGVVRPYILPIAHAARALAAHLVHAAPAPAAPPMAVQVKTPSLPLWVLPPETAAGAWTVDGPGADGVARWHDGDGRLAGFALAGAAVARKAELLREVQDARSAPFADAPGVRP